MVVKGAVGFTTYFSVAQPCKKLMVDLFEVKNQQALPWYGKLSSAILLGGAVALTSSPFDIGKTQSQMPNPSNFPILKALRNNFNHYK